MASSRKPQPAQDGARAGGKKGAPRKSTPALEAPAPPPGRDGKPAKARNGTPAKDRPAAAPSVVVGSLSCVKGPEVGGTLTLEEGGSYLVGRGRENELVLKDIAASRVHLRIVVQNGQVRVQDQGSGNGTRVNGSRVKDQALKDGDKVELGNSVLALSLSGEVKPSSSPAPQRKAAESWMGAKTQALPPEAAELRKEFLEMSLQAEPSIPPPPVASPSSREGTTNKVRTAEARALSRQQPTSNTTGTGSAQSRSGGGISRSTLIIILLIGMGLLLVALSIAVAMLATQRQAPPPAAPAPAPTQPVQSMAPQLAERAVELERAGDSQRADFMLEELKRVGSAVEWDAARQRVEALRAKKRKAAPPPVEERVEPPPEQQPEPRAVEERPVERQPEPTRAQQPPPERVESRPPPKQQQPAPKPQPKPVQKAPPPKKAAPPPKKEPAPAPKPKPKFISNDEAKEMFNKATALKRDDDFAAAIKILKEIVDKAEDGPYKEKARGALPRWQKEMKEAEEEE